MKLRACLPLLLLAAVSCSSEGKKEVASPSAKAVVAEEPADPAEPEPPVEPCTPKRVLVEGAVSLEEYHEYDLAPPLLSIEELEQNLAKTRADIANFSKEGYLHENPVYWTGVSSHEVRSVDLRTLASEIVAEMQRYGTPSLFVGEDVMGYPRIVAVWKETDAYRLLKANNNNDNNSISWKRSLGTFEPSALGLHNVRENSDASATILSLASFLKSDKTIYPHIEEYHLCTD